MISNDFASKMISLNILQNVAIYLNILFRAISQHLKMTHFHTTRQIKFPRVA